MTYVPACWRISVCHLVAYVLDLPVGDVIVGVRVGADLAEESLEPLVVLEFFEARLTLAVVFQVLAVGDKAMLKIF